MSVSFANDHDEAVTFTVKTKPAGGVVKAFQAYGIANDGAAAPDGLPKNPIAWLVFFKTAQGYLPSIPLALQKLTFACAEFVAKITGMEKKWQSTFPRPRSNVVTISPHLKAEIACSATHATPF